MFSQFDSIPEGSSVNFIVDDAEEDHDPLSEDDEDDDEDDDLFGFDNDEEDEGVTEEVGSSSDNDEDVESYNRWFEQQQQISSQRYQEEQLELAMKKRQRIAGAILSAIHLNHGRRHPSSPMQQIIRQPSPQDDSLKREPIYSILRSPGGSVIVKVPLEGYVTEEADNASGDEDDETDSKRICLGKDRSSSETSAINE